MILKDRKVNDMDKSTSMKPALELSCLLNPRYQLPQSTITCASGQVQSSARTTSQIFLFLLPFRWVTPQTPPAKSHRRRGPPRATVVVIVGPGPRSRSMLCTDPLNTSSTSRPNQLLVRFLSFNPWYLFDIIMYYRI